MNPEIITVMTKCIYFSDKSPSFYKMLPDDINLKNGQPSISFLKTLNMIEWKCCTIVVLVDKHGNFLQISIEVCQCSKIQA